MIREVPPEQTLWIISNNRGIDGAVSMLYENELHELAENLESDLYILPSSVHEVLAVSTELTEPEELAQMVAEVNMQKVALEERLSNQVYHYDKPFKCDVEGNDKNYGFNVVNVNSTELVVFEAAIDLMSYVDIFADHESNKLALGMLADAPLATFLREHPQISFIRFCLDGDSPGRKAAAELMGKYYGLGYEVEDCPPPAGYKDYNEWLVATKLNLADQKKEQMTIAGQCH